MPITKSTDLDLFLNPAVTRVGILDAETTGLKADFDVTLVVVIKVYGTKERKVFTIDISEKDLLVAEKRMLKKVAAYIMTLDGLITYYGKGFDAPFLRTRMLAQGITPFDKMKHLDAYYTVRNTLLLSRNRLMNAIELLKMADKSVPDKGRVEPRFWIAALYSRDRRALRQIRDHCIEDVDALEAAVNKLKAFLPDRVLRR